MTSAAQIRAIVHREADDLIGLAQALEGAATAIRKDAAALRAHARPGGCRPGESGLLPGWGYDYASARLHHLQTEWKGRPQP